MSNILQCQVVPRARAQQRLLAYGLPRLSQFLGFLLMLIALGLQAEASLAQDAERESMVEKPVLLDINTADATELAAALEGVGLVKAQEIVNYRTLYGDFIAVEELADVKGIGMVTVEKNRHVIVLNSAAEKDG